MASFFEAATALLRYELLNTPLPCFLDHPITETQRKKLLAFSNRYDLTHLFGDALIQNGLISAKDDVFSKSVYTAKYRVTTMESMLCEIETVLSTAKIPHIFLKGSVLRKWYPQPWMRTSCDIDVLIHKEDLENAQTALCKNGLFAAKTTGYRDVSLYSENGVHLELHFDLGEKDVCEQTAAVLSHVWGLSSPTTKGGYRYEMSAELFYFHHVAHMAKHLQIGGCGIRPFLDLWVMDNSGYFSQEACDALLAQGGLLTTAQAARALARAWIDGAEHTDLSRRLQTFVVQGGLYAGLENRMALEREQKGGKGNYLLSRIFLPYSQLKRLYPTLSSKAMVPLYQVRRWLDVVRDGRGANVSKEIKLNAQMDDEKQKQVAKLFRDLGL